MTVVALLAAATADAGAVSRRHLDATASAELASGPQCSLAGYNLKETSDLRPESWWGYDSSWNRYAYVENNPINAIDPDGEVLNFVAAGWGSLIGAVAGGGIELGRQLYKGEGVNWQKVGASTAGGAATGAVAGLTLGGSIVVEVMGAGAGATLGGVVDRGMDGDSTTVALNGNDMVVDAAGGMLGGGAARAVAPLVTSAGSEAGRQFVKNNPVLNKLVEKGGPAAAKAAGKTAGRAAAGEVVNQSQTSIPAMVPSHGQPGIRNVDQMVRSH